MLSLILTIASGICAIIIGFKIKDWRGFLLFKKIIFIANLVIFAICAGLLINEKIDENKWEKASKNVGELESESVIYPRIIIKNTPIIFENKLGVVQWNETDGITNQVLPIPLLNLKVINNKMFVDFILRNSHGDPIVTIYQNVWKTYSNDYDYNYDDRALEIITRDHKLILQLEYYGLSAYFTGFVGFQEGGGGCYFKNFPNDKGGFIIIGKDDDFAKYGEGMPLLFKYPRELYPGVRAN
jgi:hypothetical protein